VDKPAGPTSHDVVARVRKALRTRAVGHTGTLDPFATGLLVVLVGRATRLARFVEQQPKTYAATIRLGTCTTTDDLTGEVIAAPRDRRLRPPELAEIATTLQRLAGPGRQRPPAFSAKHVGGERSYAKARRGEAVPLAEIEIVVHAVELLGYAYPDLQIRTVVSPGTYVRALARDLGEQLGSGAHLVALRREAIGPLRVEEAIALERVGPEALRPPLAVLPQLPRVEVMEADAAALGHGRAVRPLGPSGRGAVTLVHEGRLIAVGHWQEGVVQPDVVLEARA
jgi:tRNA pseudouridine55 synthase